jgi:hypothetical protein
VSVGEIGIAHIIRRRAALKERAKMTLKRTLCVLLLEEFPVLTLLESARVVLGSSELPFEFRRAHPELCTERRFGDESIDDLTPELQNLIEIRMKR